jgi:hypothetical protein
MYLKLADFFANIVISSFDATSIIRNVHGKVSFRRNCESIRVDAAQMNDVAASRLNPKRNAQRTLNSQIYPNVQARYGILVHQLIRKLWQSVTRLLLARARAVLSLLTGDARVMMTFTKQSHALKHFAFIYVVCWTSLARRGITKSSALSHNHN